MFAQVGGRSDDCVTLDQELFRFVVSTSVLSRINMDIETPTSSKEIAKVVSRLLSRPVSYTHLTLPTTPYV